MRIHSTLIGGFVLGRDRHRGSKSAARYRRQREPDDRGHHNGVYRALNVVVVRTIDGVEHMIHYTKISCCTAGKELAPTRCRD